MTHVATSDLVSAAVDNRSAVPAFNVISLDQAEGIVAGVERAQSTAILQISENAIAHHGGFLEPIVAACVELADNSLAELAIHLDHFRDPDLLTRAIQHGRRLGVSSIMVDASYLPHAENVERTRLCTDLAHAQGLWVEAELGEIGGKDGAHAPGVRTDPAEAAEYVRRTGVDGLAVAVGSSHAMSSKNAQLDQELITTIASAVPVPLVLHGSSGVPDDGLTAAVASGMRKINIGTALNIEYTGAVRHYLDANPAASDPRKYIREGRDAIATLVAHLCTLLSSSAQQPAAYQ
ncbi:class II fructose-bisphosphate aldolase [Rhodococcus marinonascens]|uniref:class II fructose-bisphosphate aldolase n=1 Tax=Rhodococcus marinonascens TaxID=38311 RepID=UPI0009325338|nr:class II fructose-bisphosphate aldolase [Rhodococcus marinonascens]